MVADIARVPYHESTIISRLEELAQQITTDYADKDLTVDSILNGSFIFMADLPHRFPLPQQIDSWSASSYHGAKSRGQILFRQQHIADVRGRHFLLLDNMLNSGLALRAIQERLATDVGAASIRSCMLLRKNVALCSAFPLQNWIP